MKKFEEEFWDRPPVRRVPDLEPDFDKFKREYLDKMEPITEEERRSIAERNRQLLVKRARQKRRILSMAACAAVAVGVVGTAIWLGHDGAVMPHPESGAEETDSAVSTTETTETDGTTETTDRHMEDIDVWTYEDVIQLTGLPLVKADDIEGFLEYQVDEKNEEPYWIIYVFEQGAIYVHLNVANFPELPNAQSVILNEKQYLVNQSLFAENQIKLDIYFSSNSKVLFTGEFVNMSVEDAVQLFNILVF